jgi:hypothetical protein
VLLAELNAIQEKRSQTHSAKKRLCYLKLTRNALNNLTNELDVSQDEIHKIILEDLNTACGITRYRKFSAASPDEEFPAGHYSIFGVSYKYHVAVGQEYIDIINAQTLPSSTLEQNRERAWVPPYEFKFGKPLVMWEEMLRKS